MLFWYLACRCSRHATNEGPAERAGEAIDNTAKSVAKQTGEAMENVGNAIQEKSREASDAMDDKKPAN